MRKAKKIEVKKTVSRKREVIIPKQHRRAKNVTDDLQATMDDQWLEVSLEPRRNSHPRGAISCWLVPPWQSS